MGCYLNNLPWERHHPRSVISERTLPIKTIRFSLSLIPLHALQGHVGTKYGVPFPVFLRSVFGFHGSKVAALVRAFVGSLIPFFRSF